MKLKKEKERGNKKRKEKRSEEKRRYEKKEKKKRKNRMKDKYITFVGKTTFISINEFFE